MKRVLTCRWAQLVAALLFLAAILAGWTWFVDHLPPRPRHSLQLDNYDRPIFSPDGKLLLSWTFSKDTSVAELRVVLWELWELETGKRRWSVPVDLTELRDIEFSPDGKFIAAKNNTRLLLWDTADGKQRLDKVLGVVDEWGSAYFWTGFSPDGRYLLSKSPRRAIDETTFWDLTADADRDGVAIPGDFQRFSADGKRFAMVREEYDPHRYTVSLWEIPDGGSAPSLWKRKQIPAPGERTRYGAFTFSPDLQACAFVGGQQGDELQQWDLSGAEEPARLIHEQPGLGGLHFDEERGGYCIDYSSDGRFLIAAFRGGDVNQDGLPVLSYLKLIVWDSRGELRSIHCLKTVPVVSPGGRWVLLSDTDGGDVWEVGTHRKHLDLRVPTDHDPGKAPLIVTGLPVGPALPTLPAAKYQFSPGGRFVAVAGMQTTTTPNLMEMVFTGQWGRINKPETVPVGRLWDVERGEEIAAYYHCDDVVFSPDGRTLATMDCHYPDPMTVRFWDVPRRRPVGLILALTTVTWGLALLLCRAVRCRLRHRPESTTPRGISR